MTSQYKVRDTHLIAAYSANVKIFQKVNREADIVIQQAKPQSVMSASTTNAESKLCAAEEAQES